MPLRHGARSARFVDTVAAELAAALFDDRPDLADYPEAVAAWARHETMVLLYAEYHARLGSPFDEDGNVVGGSYYFTAEKAAQRMRERLGLDPRADAELQSARAQAVHLVADLEAIRARGRAVIEQRRAELGVAPGSAQLAPGSGSLVAVDDDMSDPGNGAQELAQEAR